MRKINFLLIVAVVFSYTVLPGCNSQTKSRTSVLPKFDEQAHRGGRGLMPENTIPAMLDAIDRGVNTLELDLQISKDNKVLVSHDPTFNYLITTTPEGDTLTKDESKTRILYSMDYDSIAKYDVGLKFNPNFPQKKNIPAVKPLLSDLIAQSEAYAKTKGKTMLYNMEIKTSGEKGDGVMHPYIPEFVDMAIKVITDGGVRERTTIQSFDTRALVYLHQKYPDVIASYLIGKKENRPMKELFDALGFIPDVLSPDYVIVTPEMIADCHAMGVKVLPWTVNDAAEIKRLKDMGVDGIITDYPNLFAEIK